ncbi:Pectinesterase, catalytic [Corchorus olitorius]|nr:Pectinesterase, catalytic [Corchorus olitorius]OMP11974.1 Pectinesterase, catalytic [Corchorus olitorius]
MSEIVNPEGWSNKFHPERESTVFFGEYKCTGKGASSSGRVKFTKALTDDQVKPFLDLSFIDAMKWLLPPPNKV